ncbi:MAG: hypothetical protein SVR04_06705 [Spirochaetota bacterium]|nr:hypothetical protein [Spirochaetota bacterium]
MAVTTEKTAKQVIFDFLDGQPVGARFRGYDLHFRVMNTLNEIHYIDTYLRYLREYRQKTGRLIVNVDKAKSIYEVMS